MEEEHHDEEFITYFHLWTTIPSVFILVVVLVLGFLANGFICYAVYRKKIGMPYLNPVLIAMAIKNIVTVTTCIPLAFAMLFDTSTMVFHTCVIQESLTFITIFAGHLLPALLSVIQCDHVTKQNREHVIGNKVYIVLFVVLCLSVILSAQTEFIDDHYCHLWTRLMDEVVLNIVFSIIGSAILSIIIMVTCYVIIYRHAVVSMKSLKTTHVRGGGSQQNSSGNQNLVSYNRKRSTAILKPMICIVVVNCGMLLPWIVLFAVTLRDQERNEKYAELRVLAMSIMYLIVVSDPVIFICFSTKGRSALKLLFSKCSNRVQPSTAPQLEERSKVSCVTSRIPSNTGL